MSGEVAREPSGRSRLKNRIIDSAVSKVLSQLETTGQFSGMATIRRLGVTGMVSTALVSNEKLAMNVGRALSDYGYPDAVIIVPTSYKGDSADERDWPAQVYANGIQTSGVQTLPPEFEQLWPKRVHEVKDHE